MKRKYIIVPLVFLFFTTLQSCKKYLDINRDPNAPAVVSEPLMTSAILSSFAFEVAGGYPVRLVSLWTKHLADASVGPHEGNYLLTPNDVNNFWRFTSYTKIMGTAKELFEKGDKNGNPAYSAIGRIVMAWNLAYLTECYGSIPYTKAFMGEFKDVKPAYDSQEEIYKQIQALLDQAVIDAAKTTGLKPGKEDFIYQGQMVRWLHLANTLKARFHLRLSNAPGYNAATQANLALTALNAGAITAAEAPTMAYFAAANADNPWYQYAIDGKWTLSIRPSLYYVNMLKATADPRLDFQVAKVTAGPDINQYVGITNDAAPRALTNYSAIGSFYSAQNAKLNLLLYSEVPFIRAEAEFLKAGKIVNQAVIDAYEAGIAASMSLYGITTYPAYLASNKMLLTTTPAAAYNMIMTQKYIANYLQFEPYNDFRRTGLPALPLNTEVYPGGTLTGQPVLAIIPLRLPYPSSEIAYNAGNIPSDISVDPAKSMIVPVWWDK